MRGFRLSLVPFVALTKAVNASNAGAVVGALLQIVGAPQGPVNFLQSLKRREGPYANKLARASSPEELYEATRGVWKIGDRRDDARYAFAVAGGIVREVYRISQWHPAGSTPYITRPASDVQVLGRWEFTGVVAPGAVRDKYLGRSVAHYFAQGNVNPITYVNA